MTLNLIHNGLLCREEAVFSRYSVCWYVSMERGRVESKQGRCVVLTVHPGLGGRFIATITIIVSSQLSTIDLGLPRKSREYDLVERMQILIHLCSVKHWVTYVRG